MADRLFSVVGDGRISGNTLTNVNVGNRTTNYHIYHHERMLPFSILLSNSVLIIRRHNLYPRVASLV